MEQAQNVFQASIIEVGECYRVSLIDLYLISFVHTLKSMSLRFFSFVALGLYLLSCSSVRNHRHANPSVDSFQYQECRTPILFNDTLAYLNQHGHLVYSALDSVKSSWELLYAKLELDSLRVMETRMAEPAFVLASSGKNLNAFVYTPVLKVGDAFFFAPDSEYKYHVVICVCNQRDSISEIVLFNDLMCCGHKGCIRTDSYIEIRNCREVLLGE